VNWLFRRHFWLLHLVFLCITAVVAAKIFTTVFGYWLSKSIPERPPAALFAEPQEKISLKNYSGANERNIFKAKREKISWVDDFEQETDPGRWQDAGPTTLPLKLVGTTVFTNPFQSRATILNMSRGVSLIYSLGECEPYKKNYDRRSIETVLPEQKWIPERPCNSIDGLATLKRIEEFRAIIFNEQSRKYEVLSILPDGKMPIFDRSSLIPEEDGEGIRQTGATSYQIKRKEFDKALSNVTQLMTEAQARPKKDERDNFIGFEITYIKKGSLFEKIGIKEKDVLTRINAYDLDSPEKALQLFSTLRTAERFTIDLKRDTQPVTLDYSVVR
jgi:general secretion pathway protein C